MLVRERILVQIIKSIGNKVKVDKQYFFKLKDFCVVKEIIDGMKKCYIKWKVVLVSYELKGVDI